MSAYQDDDLAQLETHGVPALPPTEGTYVDSNGARLWCAAWGEGPAVVLLHGGLGNSRNWGHQVPSLVGAGYRVVAVDTRGHGKSTRGERPLSYDLLADDIRAVLDALQMDRAAFVGWSDGAVTALKFALQTPERCAGLFFFACNVDASGTKPFTPTPTIDRIYNHHVREYEALSPTPTAFEALRDELGPMQASQPNLSADELGKVNVPIWSVIGESDEFIERAHAEYIAASIPGAKFVLLPGVSHFAPLQRPDAFNAVVLAFLLAARR